MLTQRVRLSLPFRTDLLADAVLSDAGNGIRALQLNVQWRLSNDADGKPAKRNYSMRARLNEMLTISVYACAGQTSFDVHVTPNALHPRCTSHKPCVEYGLGAVSTPPN